MSDRQLNTGPCFGDYVRIDVPAVEVEGYVLEPAETEYGIVMYIDSNSIQIADEVSKEFELSRDSRVKVYDIHKVSVTIL